MSTTDAKLKLLRQHERYLTAHHEAGHAVAAVLPGGSFESISIEPTMMRDGLVHLRGVKVLDADFVIFAGPWADARADWAGPLDGVDHNGLTFMAYLRASMRVNADDLRQYANDQDLPSELLCAAMSGEPEPEIPLARDESWYGELDSSWPAIQSVADMLLNGIEVTPDAVNVLLGLTSSEDNRIST